MNKDEFIARLKELLMPKDGDREYERKETEAVNLINMLIWDVTQKSGGEWNEAVAKECFTQFEWLHKQP